jgi:methyltransferase
MVGYLLLLALIGLERLLELARSRRNAAWAFGRGGIELGRRHLRFMTGLHALFLPACALEVWLLGRPFIPALGLPMLGLVAIGQGLRMWAVGTLGRRWNVRTIVVPGLPVVTRGPYRIVRHPNYVAVVLEGIAVPLVHTAWLTAVGFTLLNLPLLAIRIRCEETALAEHSDYARLKDVPRFLPRPR